MMKILKAVITVFLAAVVILLLIPFFLGTFSVISLGAILLSGLIPALWYLPGLSGKIRSFKFGKALLRVFWTVIIAGSLYAAVCGGLILSGMSESEPPEGSTVLVLGCTIYGSEPSPVLVSRLDVAYSYLETHPEADCILSGGQGKHEDITEGEAMKNYLAARGIEAGRLFVEGESHSTDDNMRLSRDIIQSQGLNSTVVIVSDGFHMYRSGLLAEKYGLEYSLLPSKTPWYMFTPNFIREILALTKYFITG